MVPLCPKKILGLVETRVNAALAMPIFQAFPALCPCEPRLPRGEMQAVLCGARSNTRLLPASTTQPLLLASALSGKYETAICLFVQAKTVLTFGHV